MPLLETVRVLDLTNVLAGPFCCYQLAQLGAEPELNRKVSLAPPVSITAFIPSTRARQGY